MADITKNIQMSLDECRMLILAGQVLLSFTAESALEPGFAELQPHGRALCAIGMGLLVVSITLLMGPAAYHVTVCRGRDGPRIRRYVTRAITTAILPFAVGFAAILCVVGERISGPGVGVVMSAAWLLAALAGLYIIPWMQRSPKEAGGSAMTPTTTHRDLETKIGHVLTETRMVLPGAQAMLGFGSISVLMDAFKKLPHELKIVHLAGLAFIALSVILLMAPAAYHRIAARGEPSERLYTVAVRLLLGAMALLAPGIGAAVWLVFELAFDSRLAGVLAGITTVLIGYGLWFGMTALAAAGEFRRERSAPRPARAR